MAARKPFLLRIDPAVLDAVQRWAADDLRSLNGQIEYLLRRALVDGKRWKPAAGAEATEDGESSLQRETDQGGASSSS
jgi:hypothetical protein